MTFFIHLVKTVSNLMLGLAIIMLLIAQALGKCAIYPLNEGSYCDCLNVMNYTEVLRKCDNEYIVAIKVHSSYLVHMHFVADLQLYHIINSTKSFIVMNNRKLVINTEEQNIFNYLPSLVHLVMRKNNLEYVPNNLISKSSIESLDLQSNNFSSIPKIKSVTLKKMDLTHNLISSINKNDFEHLPAIEEIILEDNKLQFVDSEIFLSLRSLQRLYLYTNLWKCNCTSVKLFRDLKQIARTENEVKCYNETKEEKVLVDANGITPEFVEMCPLPLEKMSERVIDNGISKHDQLSLLLVFPIVLYNVL